MTRSYLTTSLIVFVACLVFANSQRARADGKLVPPRNYKGSLEEQSQEAIIIFKGGDNNKSAKQQMILKIRVAGDVDNFAWVVPIPKTPKIETADPKLFEELFRYVQAQQRRSTPSKGEKSAGQASDNKATLAKPAVEVIKREVVGSYDITVVKENKKDSLNTWLTDNGYQALDNANDVLDFYRKKEYVFACMKVTNVEKKKGQSADLHPLSFTFETGGRDGMIFPMRLTGLQNDPFTVNLYIFYRYWLNDRINEFGYTNRDFRLVHRDWDTRQCKANGGKAWFAPESDPMLKRAAHTIPTVKKFFAKNYPNDRFYLTNIQARRLKPQAVRAWKDDLWMFPHYNDKKMVPYDVRDKGPASYGWPGRSANAEAQPTTVNAGFGGAVPVVAVIALLLAAGMSVWVTRQRTG